MVAAVMCIGASLSYELILCRRYERRRRAWDIRRRTFGGGFLQKDFSLWIFLKSVPAIENILGHFGEMDLGLWCVVAAVMHIGASLSYELVQPTVFSIANGSSGCNSTPNSPVTTRGCR